MTSTLLTSPSEFTTSTDEIDWLGFDVTADLSGSEAAVTAACELRTIYTRVDAPSSAFPTPASVTANVVLQKYDATVLTAGKYEWIWNVTLNTGAVRSYRTTLIVENHD